MPETKPNMTRKHYEWIAEVIADLPHNATRQAVAEHFADELAETSTGFQRQRFLDAVDRYGGL